MRENGDRSARLDSVWLRRNDLEFEQEIKRQRELESLEEALPPSVVEACARFDSERHQRDQFPVGAYFDSIDKRRHDGRRATAEKLFVVAEVGKELLYEAICAADEDDNEEFFVQAYECWGPLVDTVLQECDRESALTASGDTARNRPGFDHAQLLHRFCARAVLVMRGQLKACRCCCRSSGPRSLDGSRAPHHRFAYGSGEPRRLSVQRRK